VVNVSLTASGKRILFQLTALHHGQARRIQQFFGSRAAAGPPTAEKRSAGAGRRQPKPEQSL
jgi:hypothetical protein